MLLCSLFTIPSSISYFLVFLHYSKSNALLPNKSLCKTSLTLFKAAVIVNRCLCNSIFVYRYKAIDNKEKKFSKKYIVVSATVCLVSTFQLVFERLYTWFMSPFEKQDCFYFHVDLSRHLVQFLVVLSCFAITTFLQIGILIVTVIPICKHSNNLIISNERVRSLMKRIVVCTCLFAVSDFGLAAAQLILIRLIGRPMSALLLVNVNLDCLSLMLSYDDYKQRVFPLLNCSTKSSVERVRRKESKQVENEKKDTLKENKDANKTIEMV